MHKVHLLLDTIRAKGGDGVVLQGNLEKTKDCRNLVKQAIKAFGSIGVLVNNAAFLHQQPFLDIPEEEWDKTFAINLKAPFTLAQEIFPHMKSNGSGKIINIASSGGQLGGPLAPHYAASKAGLICLTKSLARLGGPHNIIVNAISPGLVATDMITDELASPAGQEKLRQIPLGRTATPEEIATFVLFLASDESSYATGQTFNVNGGLYMG